MNKRLEFIKRRFGVDPARIRDPEPPPQRTPIEQLILGRLDQLAVQKMIVKKWYENKWLWIAASSIIFFLLGHFIR